MTDLNATRKACDALLEQLLPNPKNRETWWSSPNYELGLNTPEEQLIEDPSVVLGYLKHFVGEQYS